PRMSSEYKQTARTRAPRLRSGQAKIRATAKTHICQKQADVGHRGVGATPEQAMLRFFATHGQTWAGSERSCGRTNSPAACIARVSPCVTSGNACIYPRGKASLRMAKTHRSKK